MIMAEHEHLNRYLLEHPVLDGVLTIFVAIPAGAVIGFALMIALNWPDSSQVREQKAAALAVEKFARWNAT